MTDLARLDAPRLFPVIYWQSKGAKPGPMQIPWSVAEQAYSAYSSTYGRDQTLERLAERGGFHAGELDRFLPDWREQSSEITALRSQLREMAVEIAETNTVPRSRYDACNADWLAAKDYIKRMDAVIDDAGIARSCINPLEDLKRAVQGMKDRLAAVSAERDELRAKAAFPETVAGLQALKSRVDFALCHAVLGDQSKGVVFAARAASEGNEGKGAQGGR